MGLHPSSKAIVIHNGKLLLYLRDNTPTINHPDMWDVPGSDLQKDESYLDALKRSLNSQFSIIPQHINHYKKVLNAEGIPCEVFVVTLETKDAKSIKFKGIGQKYAFYSLQEALALELTPSVRMFLSSNLDELESLCQPVPTSTK